MESINNLTSFGVSDPRDRADQSTADSGIGDSLSLSSRSQSGLRASTSSGIGTTRMLVTTATTLPVRLLEEEKGQQGQHLSVVHCTSVLRSRNRISVEWREGEGSRAVGDTHPNAAGEITKRRRRRRRRRGTGRRDNVYLDCSRVFNRVSKLSRHRRVHIGEKPFYCACCHKAFATLILFLLILLLLFYLAS